ncbi:unnamed protein product [Choristocarpus tenellus]
MLASCVANKLQELNPMVPVRVIQGALTEATISAHSVVVFCGQPPEDTIRWDTFCHEKGVIFISSGTMGAFGYVFSDFGESFSIHDLNGEVPTSYPITYVSRWCL